VRATGRPARIGVALAGLIPFGVLVGRAATGTLGPDPVETLTHETGQWALRCLLLTLAVTPARRLLGWAALAPHRRTFGLLAYFYACLHFATYLVFDLGFDVAELATDVRDRPYITVGFATLLLLTPLAATSTRRAIRRLGRRWQRLHRLVYAAAVGAVVHFLWSVKADPTEPLVYGAVAAALLLLRLRGRSGRGRRSYATIPRSSAQGGAPGTARSASDEPA
jgi:sulfoxide reductase heme-binding subunit YedZ